MDIPISTLPMGEGDNRVAGSQFPRPLIKRLFAPYPIGATLFMGCQGLPWAGFGASPNPYLSLGF